MLAPGGEFVTQQVGDAGADIRRLLGLPATPAPSCTAQVAAAQLAAAGLVVTDTGEGHQLLAFGDAGALGGTCASRPG